ncbi:hypothetical protein [Kordia sp.]|uniref:hypothetical protein n=1 Tax=Kordia sp. TaxID=1965332 RepID=UPI003D6AD16A
MIDKLGKLLPIGTLFLILCSSIRTIYYYQGFNISIVDYMELSEFIISFLDDIYLYLLIIFSPLIWQLLNDFFSNNDIATEPAKLKSNRKLFFRNLTIVYFFALAAIVVSKIFFINYYVYGVAFFVIILIYIFFVIFKGSKIDNLSKYLAVVPTLIFLSFIDANFSKLRILEREKSNYNVKLAFDGSTIKTTNDLQFIGQCKNYVFFYNINNKISTAYKKDNISMLEISRKD